MALIRRVASLLLHISCGQHLGQTADSFDRTGQPRLIVAVPNLVPKGKGLGFGSNPKAQPIRTLLRWASLVCPELNALLVVLRYSTTTRPAQSPIPCRPTP